jgi:hypothetical protein
MEPITISLILTSTLGYIFKAVSDTKVVKDAENNALEKFWNWIKPRFKSAAEIETKPDLPETQLKAEEELLEMVKDKEFFEKLAEHIEILKKAQITEKNIVRGSIRNVKKIRIGDKEHSPEDHFYTHKNIVEGEVSDADEFSLGDGY